MLNIGKFIIIVVDHNCDNDHGLSLDYLNRSEEFPVLFSSDKNESVSLKSLSDIKYLNRFSLK